MWGWLLWWVSEERENTEALRCAQNDGEKQTTTAASANTGVSPLRFAPVEMTSFGRSGGEQATAPLAVIKSKLRCETWQRSLLLSPDMAETFKSGPGVGLA